MRRDYPDKHILFNDRKGVKFITQENICGQTDGILRRQAHRVLGHTIARDKTVKRAIVMNRAIPACSQYMLYLQEILPADYTYQLPVVDHW